VLLHRSEDLRLIEARATTKRVARTFAIACRMLPRALRDDVYLLYLVFRTLDDLVDTGDPDAEDRIAAVEAWCAGEQPRSSEAGLLADLERRHPIPRATMADFCAGMRDDLRATELATESDLDVYCYRVAGTVGVVMSALLGATDPAAPQHASALGQAMQRTNILRDIDEDLDAGRVYLARETLERFGWATVPPPSCREELLRDQIARADALYEVGIAGIAMLPCGRRAIAAAGAMYREILRQIERDGYGSQAGRAIVSRKRKLFVAARAPMPGRHA
jgi:phytoene synthase